MVKGAPFRMRSFYQMMPSHQIEMLQNLVRHGPRTYHPPTARDITDMFFGPVKGAWKLVKGAYRWVVGRKRPFHKRKRPFSFNARNYKKSMGALARLRAANP